MSSEDNLVQATYRYRNNLASSREANCSPLTLASFSNFFALYWNLDQSLKSNPKIVSVFQVNNTFSCYYDPENTEDVARILKVEFHSHPLPNPLPCRSNCAFQGHHPIPR